MAARNDIPPHEFYEKWNMYDLYLYDLSRTRLHTERSFWQVWTGCNVANQYQKKDKMLRPDKILGLKKPRGVKLVKDDVPEGFVEIDGESSVDRSIRLARAITYLESKKEMSRWDLEEFE